MPAAAPAAPPAAPATDVPRHVADLSDIQRCADSKKDDVMDRTSVNTQSWIAFRFQFYMALITRCNIWTQLNTLAAVPCDVPYATRDSIFKERHRASSAEHPPGKACVRFAAIQQCEGSGPARRGGDAHRNACRAWGGPAVLVRSRPGEKNAGASGACLPNAPSLSKMLTPFFSGAFGSQDAPPCPLNPRSGTRPPSGYAGGGPRAVSGRRTARNAAS